MLNINFSALNDKESEEKENEESEEKNEEEENEDILSDTEDAQSLQVAPSPKTPFKPSSQSKNYASEGFFLIKI